MSYILDALRKSEEARRRQQGADLSLSEAPLPIERGHRSHLLPVLAVALIVNAVVFGAWLLRSTPDAATATTPGPLPAPLPAPMAEPTATERVQAPPAAPLAPARPDWSSLPVRALSSLPASERRPFERLIISTHVYAEEPSFREVGIGGRIYREGERIDGMTLVAITATGIELGVDDRVIAIDLQDQWDF